MGTPQQRISPSKESRSRQIQKLKTQENQDLPTAFLQNRILARVKSQRQINRFRILHGRLPKLEEQRRNLPSPIAWISTSSDIWLLSPNAAHLIFQLVSRRYERGGSCLPAPHVGEWSIDRSNSDPHPPHSRPSSFFCLS